jgi:2-hydroxychromene-2-carboxylate isomerase
LKTVVFYFDVVCPWAYLASLRVEETARAMGARFSPRPILLGGVFRSIGREETPTPAVKLAYQARDLARWAELDGAEVRMPAEHPRRTVDAMRLVHAAPDEARWPLAQALYRAYWVEGRDVADRAVLAEIGARFGVAIERVDDGAVKDSLRAATDEAVAAGVFGVPAFVVDGRLTWGRDRMDILAAAPPLPRPTSRGTIELYYDFSSPFAWLGLERASLLPDIALRPILLGALFADIGTPNVPLMTFSEPKRRWVMADLDDAARRLGLALRWPSRFPMRTVKALRMVLAAPAEARLALSRALFRAYWSEDRDIDDPSVLGQVAASVGLDDKIVERAMSDPALKEELRSATAAAEARGVFGVPSFFVGDEMFWGHDRFELVERQLPRQ